VLQAAGEKAQPDRQQAANGQGLHEAGLWRLGVHGLPAVFQPGPKHEQNHADRGGPHGAFAAEKAVVDGARDEADARVLEQHRTMVLLKRRSHVCHPVRKRIREFKPFATHDPSQRGT